MNEKVELLKSMHSALNNIVVQGKQNHIIVVALMNDIEKLIAAIEKEESPCSLNT